jgi:hypothetical protein
MTCVCRKCGAPGGPVLPLLSNTTVFPPRCAACGGPLKPSAVLFGEAIPPGAAAEAAAAASACDVFLVVGTSASVRPAADLPRLALAAGAQVIEVNTEATGLTGRYSDIILRGRAGVVLPQVLEAVKRLRSARGGGSVARSGLVADRGGGGGAGARAARVCLPQLRRSCRRRVTAAAHAHSARMVLHRCLLA